MNKTNTLSRKFVLILILLQLCMQSCEEEHSNNNETDTTVTDIDGNIYTKVSIGNQIWMGENLRTTRYSDGKEIRLIESQTDWDALSANEKIYCYYDNDSAYADPYGALYNWKAAMNGASSSNNNPSKVQGACPSGWHIPSKAEWEELINYLGGNYIAGGKMKEIGTIHWLINEGATNESGFTALPAGIRYSNEYYGYSFGNLGYWSIHWSSTNANGAYGCGVYSTHTEAQIDPLQPGKGFSLRCIKD